jgi:hypothetical protein
MELILGPRSELRSSEGATMGLRGELETGGLVGERDGDDG